MITSKLRVSRKRGSNIQYLVKQIYLGKFMISYEVIDKEIIPEHVMISVGAFGDCGEWHSKFADIQEAWVK